MLIVADELFLRVPERNFLSIVEGYSGGSRVTPSPGERDTMRWPNLTIGPGEAVTNFQAAHDLLPISLAGLPLIFRCR